jgi:GT2 family glycosyltransferase
MKRIAIYCVNYHSYDYLNDYLASIDVAMLQATDAVSLSVIVADNTTPAQPVSYHPTHYSLHVIATGANLGYFGAVRQGMLQVSPLDYDYIIVSNVDVLVGQDFFTTLSRYHVAPKTAWIAPAILSQSLHFDFNPQALHRYSYRKMRLLRIMFRFPFLLRLKQKLLHQYRNIQLSAAQTIYAGHGSFIILTNEYFLQCGIINYPLFLYGEEIWLAEMCRKHGLQVAYVPDIKVTDIGRVSTGRYTSRQYCQFNYLAIDYIIRSFYP